MEQQMAEELLQAIVELNRRLRHTGRAIDLGFSEIKILNILIHHECSKEESTACIQMKDLSERMRISRPALNALIDKLEAKELVRRIQKPGDRKSVYVSPTEKSQAIYNEQRAHLINFLLPIIETLGVSDTKTLIELVRRFNDIVKKEQHRNEPNA